MKTLSLTSAILDKMPQIGKWQRAFFSHLIPLFLSIRGRINFSQMARYGIFSLTTYRNNFDKPFDFLTFNTHHVEMQSSGYNVILLIAAIVMVIPNNILLIFKRHFLVFARILQSYPHKEFDFLLPPQLLKLTYFLQH